MLPSLHKPLPPGKRNSPRESQDMSGEGAQSSAMALNHPSTGIRAKKTPLFEKRLDSFCVGVGWDYCLQTGSEH